MSGDEAIELVEKENFDLVLLDEMMPGKDGLTTLEEIKELKPHLPVVMVTKSEEESLMDDAIGQKIDDYLVKPVNPSQIIIVIKRLLDARKIISGSSMKRYITEINKFNDKLDGKMEPEDWFEAAWILSSWDLELDNNADVGLAQTLEGTRKEWNNAFTKYIEHNYLGWLRSENRPLLSPDITSRYVVPDLKKKNKILFIVVDCMRLDQWMLIEPLIVEYFNIDRNYYYSILPTATPFSRNALFAGMFPDEIHRVYPETYAVTDEGSLNRFEDRFLADNLSRQGVRPAGSKYVKIFSSFCQAIQIKMIEFSHPVVFVYNIKSRRGSILFFYSHALGQTLYKNGFACSKFSAEHNQAAIGKHCSHLFSQRNCFRLGMGNYVKYSGQTLISGLILPAAQPSLLKKHRHAGMIFENA